MIDLIYQILRTITNKELRGNVTPAEFNLLARQVQNKIYRGYFEDENRDKIKQNRGFTNKNFSNLSFIQRQRIEEFAAISVLTYNNTTQLFELPSDIYLIKDKGIDFNGNVIDEAESSNITFMNSSLGAPSETFPVFEMYKDVIKVHPDTIQTGVTCRYLRLPNDPNWTYQDVGGTEMFDPSSVDFQDFELHESEMTRIVIEMLSYFGINLRETEVTQYAEALKRIVESKEEN